MWFGIGRRGLGLARRKEVGSRRRPIEELLAVGGGVGIVAAVWDLAAKFRGRVSLEPVLPATAWGVSWEMCVGLCAGDWQGEGFSPWAPGLSRCAVDS